MAAKKSSCMRFRWSKLMPGFASEKRPGRSWITRCMRGCSLSKSDNLLHTLPRHSTIVILNVRRVPACGCRKDLETEGSAPLRPRSLTEYRSDDGAILSQLDDAV